eukprot:SM000069S20654  [mRNA]  locus=s69:57225:58159:+ [translate_table: standard]
MVYIDSWDEFAEKAELLFRAEPLRTRYVMKYRHCQGQLVLKVTDDNVVRHVGSAAAPEAGRDRCLKYKTDQAQDARKMEKLNNLFFTLMARGLEAVVEEEAVKELQPQPSVGKKGRRRQ